MQIFNDQNMLKWYNQSFSKYFDNDCEKVFILLIRKNKYRKVRYTLIELKHFLNFFSGIIAEIIKPNGESHFLSANIGIIRFNSSLDQVIILLFI